MIIFFIFTKQIRIFFYKIRYFTVIYRLSQYSKNSRKSTAGELPFTCVCGDDLHGALLTFGRGISCMALR
jgi:hypothetical protein